MKKILCAALVLCLFMSTVFPVTAFAANYDTGYEASETIPIYHPEDEPPDYSTIDYEAPDSGTLEPELPELEAPEEEPYEPEECKPEPPGTEIPELGAPETELYEPEEYEPCPPELEVPELEAPEILAPLPEYGISALAGTVTQVASFPQLQAAVAASVNGVEKRIEVVSSFAFEETIVIPANRIITLSAGTPPPGAFSSFGGNHELIAPAGTRHFVVQRQATFNLQSGVTLAGNGDVGGGVDNQGTFNMSGNSAIKNNKVHSDISLANGGGVNNDGVFTMTDNAGVIGNVAYGRVSAVYGGGVNSVGTLYMSGDAVIAYNTAHSETRPVYGGGVNFFLGIFNMSGNARVSDNVASSRRLSAHGGGVNFGHTTFYMSGNASITGNTSQSDTVAAYGGGVSFGSGHFYISGNSLISENRVLGRTAAVYGGGVFHRGGTITMADNATISHNLAETQSGVTAVGGGIRSGSDTTISMSGNARITGNIAADGGGVSLSLDSVLNMDDSATISGNMATHSGGGVSISRSTLNVKGWAAITYNTANGNGGGVSAFRSSINVNGGRVSGNMAMNGGGIFGDGAWGWTESASMVDITSGEISNNTAWADGGGIMAALPNLTVGACAVFWNNQASIPVPFRNPADDMLYYQNIFGMHWTSPFIQGYNNFDIGYRPWHNHLVTVTFMGNGGIPHIESRTIPFATSVGWGLMPHVYRTGYIQIGWIDNNGNLFDENTLVFEDIIVFAQWIPIAVPTFTVTYSGNGHTGGNAPVDSNVYALGDDVTVLSQGNLERVVYTQGTSYTVHAFLGWKELDATGTAVTGILFAPGDTFVIYRNITLFAQWEAIIPVPEYATVAFYGNGGTILPENATRQVLVGAALGADMPADPERYGYDFLGWSIKPTDPVAPFAAVPFTAATVVTASITVRAEWEPAQLPPVYLTVTFNGNRGTVLPENATRQVLAGASLGTDMPANPTRSGFNFTGWNVARNGAGVSFAAATVVNENITVYAQWTRIQPPQPNYVTVTFDGNGGTVLPENVSRQIVAGTSLGTDMPANPTRGGYNFSGWNTAQDGTGTAFAATTQITEDITVYAQWEPVHMQPVYLTVTFNGNGGAVLSANLSRRVLAGTSLGAYMPADPIRDGHSFSGWNTTREGAGAAFTASTVVSEDITVYAQWESVQLPPVYVIVTFDGNGGAVLSINTSRRVLAGTSLGEGMPDDPTRDGYSFTGWNTTREGTGAAFTASTVVTEDITVYARWTSAQQPPEAPETGRVRVIKEAEDTEERLSGAVFGIYRASDSERVARVTTGRNGVTTYVLEPGRFYLREHRAPEGFIRCFERIPFTVRAGRTVDVTVTNAPISTEETGYLHLLKLAEGTGARLPGAVFGVFRASDNSRAAEITTDRDGRAILELAPGDYFLRELRAPAGFQLETARIPFTIRNGQTVVVEVTNMRLDSPATPMPTVPGDTIQPVSGTDGDGGIRIPQTGEAFPIMNYALAVMMFGIAAVLGVVIVKRRTKGSS